jgi:branched-chain amino acid transport system permease protein
MMATGLQLVTATPRLWLLVLALGLVPLVTQDSYFLQVLGLTMLWAIFASSWNIAAGYAGLKTFGHQAFFGIGAYGSALLSMEGGLSPWLTAWFGALLAALVGIFVGLPVLRIKSLPHIAIVTLALAEIVRITCSNLVGFTRGELGLSGIPPFSAMTIPLVGTVAFGPSNRVATFYLVWCLMAATLLFTAWYVSSKWGLITQAIRDSQVAAESLGVNLPRYKLANFALSAFMAGLAGAVYAHYILVLTPTSVLGITLMVHIIAITLIGGIATLQGPLVGALVLTVSSETLRVAGDHRMLMVGLLIMAVILFLPGGLARIDVLRSEWRQRKLVRDSGGRGQSAE